MRNYLSGKGHWGHQSAPELDRLLVSLRTGDTAYLYKLVRLGRSLKHLPDLVAELEFWGVGLVSLTL